MKYSVSVNCESRGTHVTCCGSANAKVHEIKDSPQ